MVIRKQTINEIPDMFRLAIKSGVNAVEFFDLVQVSRVKEKYLEEVLSKSERRKVMEWLAEAQRNSPVVIRVPACPMYPLILKEKKIQPNIFQLVYWHESHTSKEDVLPVCLMDI